KRSGKAAARTTSPSPSPFLGFSRPFRSISPELRRARMSARILVVDDAPVNVRLLHAKLTAEYFDVVTAEDGPSALAVMEVEPPDIVLLDVMMPGMTGFEVCRRIKADPRWTHIPVVMVTALDLPEDRVEGLEAGADEFLTKP